MSHRSGFRAAVAAIALLACGATTLANATTVVRPTTGPMAQPAPAGTTSQFGGTLSGVIKSIGQATASVARKG